MISRRKSAFMVVASVLVTALLASGLTFFVVSTRGPVGKVLGVVRLLDKSFYKPVDSDALFEGAARGVVASLGDPYSVYMDKREWEEFQIRASGEYSGTGIIIGVQDGQVVLAKPMRGTPAEAAGLKAKDVILRVDGESINSSDKAALLIRGPEGTSVTLTILRGNQAFDVTITRAQITVPAVDYSMLDENIGHLALMSFNEHSATETTAALQDLRKQGAEAIILDLRYNGGGYLEQCLMIAELLVPKGPVVTLRYKSEPDKTFSTTGTGLDLPLFVLVNAGSASASEILAGAIQDRGAGVLVGQTTFGKGLVQGAFFLKDGSVVKVTTAEYLTPGGRQINGKGLDPDVTVEGDKEQLEKAWDLARAAVSGGLEQKGAGL